MKLKRKAFSLVEIAVVVAVIIILSSVTIQMLIGRRNRLALENTTKQIVSTLREAQSRSAASEKAVSWGVRLSNATNTTPFYALFKTTYSATSTVGYSRLPAYVRYSTSSIALGSAIDVMFTQISGIPSAATSITLELAPSGKTITTSTINVNADGLVAF